MGSVGDGSVALQFSGVQSLVNGGGGNATLTVSGGELKGLISGLEPPQTSFVAEGGENTVIFDSASPTRPGR